MGPSVSHRALNILQSILLIGGMGMIAWRVVATVAGPEMTLVIVFAWLTGMALAPALPKRLLLSSYGARRLTGGNFPDGITILTALARRAYLPRVPQLYYVQNRLPNAFAVGTPEDSAICVSDGLLRLLDRRELEGVLAHEVSHIANRDLWIMGVADAMSRAVSLASWVGQLVLFLNLPLYLTGDIYLPWQLPLILICSPTLMALLQLALSRTREFDADRRAADLTGDPGGLASALLKLERRVGRFWEEIFLPGRRIPEPSLLRTHPLTDARVARLREMERSRRGPWRNPDSLRIPQVAKAGPPKFRSSRIYR